MAYQQWCFTINNPNDYRPAFKPDDMAFMCYGIERGEQNGTEHIQGYVRFLTRRRFNTAKRIIGGDHQCEPHVEHCKGTELQNREYCFKQDGEHFQQGEFQPDFGMQGRRSDLDDLAQAALSGTSLRDIATRFPTSFIRYHRGIQSLIETTAPMPALERQVEVLILWGPTGTGKTHRTLHAWPTIYGAKPGRDPWGSYRGEKEILFDEFDHELWPITAMKPLPGQVALSSGRAVQRPLRRVGACGDLRKLEPAELVSERSPSPIRRFQEENSWTLLLRRQPRPEPRSPPATKSNTPVDPSEDDLSSVPPTLLLSLSESDEERNEINTLP